MARRSLADRIRARGVLLAGAGMRLDGADGSRTPQEPRERPRTAGVVSEGTPGTQTLILDGFPSPPVARALSPNGRAHWRRKQDARKIVEANVSAWLVIQKIRPMTGRVVLRPRFVFPVHRRRDDDNLATGVMKAVRDVLVAQGILADDSTQHVRQEPVEVVVEKGQRRLEIVLAPAGEREEVR